MKRIMVAVPSREQIDVNAVKCLMKVEALKHILTVTGQPFFPVRSNHRTLGEDLSFCYKARSMGYKIYADPRIYVGHIGKLIADRDSWKALQRLKDV